MTRLYDRLKIPAHQVDTRMTVTYTPVVATASNYCMFWKAMKIYRGSVYKIVWRDLLFFIVIYLTVQFTNIYVFSKSQQFAFKRMRDSFYIKRKYIPMHFVLGFFVLLVVDRWRFVHQSIPSADTFSLLLNAAITSNSEKSRLMRRATVRYVIASYIINLRTLSLKMRNRFPTFESIVSLGILLKNEEEILEKIEEKTLVTTYVIPLVWATNIINRARKEGFINNDCIVQDLLTELGHYRRKLGDLLCYDLVSIPLFYIQVVTLTIYSYFFTTIIGHQVCNEDGVQVIEIAVSLMCASLDFTFHVGWVKVAEVLINPFGEDDEDFDVDRMVDRNLKAANMIVDYMRIEEPNYHPYDYPVFGQALYENVVESKNLGENHLYCSLEEDVATQTEDEYFQIYENVPVTSAPLQLLTPSQGSTYVDYVNVLYKSIPSDEEIYSELDTKKMEETNVYENLPEASAPLQLKPLSQSSLSIDYVNVINKSITTTDAEKMEETNVYGNVPVISAPLQLKTPSQGSTYVDYVNVIIKSNHNKEKKSSESDARTLEETNACASVPQASARLQEHPLLFQSASSIEDLNAICKSNPTDEIISCELDTRTLEETNIYENVPPKQKKRSKIFSFAKFKFNRKK